MNLSTPPARMREVCSRFILSRARYPTLKGGASRGRTGEAGEEPDARNLDLWDNRTEGGSFGRNDGLTFAGDDYAKAEMKG